MHPSPRNLLTAACRIASGLLLLLASACDDSSSKSPDDIPSTPDQDNRSGSRLKLMWDSFDGTKVFSPVAFDTRLDVACLPRRWSDGNYYCTPPAGEIVYQDAACTVPMGLGERDECSRAELPQVGYFGSTEVNSCDGTISQGELRRGERRSNVPFYTREGGSCIVSTDPNVVLYTLGDPVPTSTFAKLALERTGDARIRPTFVTSEDGARFFLANHDSLLEADCFPFPSLDNQARQCFAFGVADLQYGDAACTQLKAAHPSSCPQPKFAIDTDPKADCPFDLRGYRITGATSPSPLYYPDENRECRPVDAEPDNSYYSVGESITVARFEREQPSSSTNPRIQHVVFSDGTTRASFDQLRDSQTGEDCAPRELADGTTRCLPTARTATLTLHTDSACAQPVEVTAESPAIPCLPPTPRTVIVDGEECGTDPKVFAVGDVLAGPLYVKIGTMFCTPFPGTYRRLTPVPLTDFAVGTSGRDP